MDNSPFPPLLPVFVKKAGFVLRYLLLSRYLFRRVQASLLEILFFRPSDGVFMSRQIVRPGSAFRFAFLFIFALFFSNKGAHAQRRVPPLHKINSRNPVSVLTRHYNNARTAANLEETTLNVSNVNRSTFGKLYSRDVDGELYAQPLLISGLDLPGIGSKNVLFVATAHNTIYAYDADNPDSKLAPYWKVNLGTSVPSGTIPTRNLPVEIGIISTPVIDAPSNTIYVCAKILENGFPQFYLYALDVRTGKPKQSRRLIEGSVPGTGEDNINGVVTFTPFKHNQRCALTLSNGRVYIAFASHEDYNPYHGWVFAYETSTLNRVAIHCNTPDGGYGGIWMSGEGLNVDASGNLYYINGNGTYDGVRNFGLSVVKLNPDAQVLDWFTPGNYQFLNEIDFDLGSSGGILLPGTNYLVSGGKEGIIYVMDTANLTHLHTDGDRIVQRFSASPGHIHSSMALWNSASSPTLYVWGESDTLKAFRWRGNFFDTTPTSMSTMPVADGYANGPGMAVSANGSLPGTGIVWANLPLIGDATEQHVPGILRAFDASNVSRELWNSRQNLLRDDLGTYAKFCPPVVANGQVYLSTFTGKLIVYGIQPLTPPAPVTTLSAHPGDRSALLRWDNVDRAIGFTLKRSLSAEGVFTTIATNLQTTDYRDRDLTNGTTYFYLVASTNASGSSPDSNLVLCRPGTEAHGTSINVNFVGRALPMSRTEIAGVFPAAEWNNANGGTGSLFNLTGNGIHPTDVGINWTSHDGFLIGLTDAPGDVRMMNGYLDTLDDSTTTVQISNIPQWLTGAGYRVIVYCDGDWVFRSGIYTLNGVSVTATDSTNFSGTYLNATNGSGNYIVFDGITADHLTLTATPTSGGLRAPINGIQLMLSPATLTGKINLEATPNLAQPVSLTFRPSDNSVEIPRKVTLDAQGNFTMTQMPRTSGVLHIKGRRWLARNVPLDLSSGSATLPSGITLIAGDINDDNSVDFGDLVFMLQSYNALFGDDLYRAEADLNDDGGIDFGDLSLLLQNYNTPGDD